MLASIGGPAGGGRGRMSISTAPERSLGLVGSIIKGRYRINAISSVSRDAVVYVAEEIRYGRPIALKVLRDEVAGDAEFVAAVREQATGLAMSPHVHRGLPRVYECGTTDTGELFIALERTKGATLRELLDTRGALDPSTALRITSQVGEALETLHHRRIVHGQLSPESVVLVKDDDGTERVTLVGVELTAAYRTTNGRRREPSPAAYLAPEQLAGGETTDATDQYALGMLLRELLTAERSREPIGAHTGTPSLPPEITRIVTTALDEQPEQRFPDISVMVNDMWAAQTAFPEPAARPRAGEARASTHRRSRPRRTGLTLRIAAAVATAGIIAAVVWFALSGAMASHFRALFMAPAGIAVPAVQDATTTSPVLLSVPVSVPAAPTAAPAATPTLHQPQPSKNASTVEGLAHPSAAPRPAALVERQDRAAPPVAERPATPDHGATVGGDGGAIIDWVLKRQR
jgi:serine/threonine protein kinase